MRRGAATGSADVRVARAARRRASAASEACAMPPLAAQDSDPPAVYLLHGRRVAVPCTSSGCTPRRDLRPAWSARTTPLAGSPGARRPAGHWTAIIRDRQSVSR